MLSGLSMGWIIAGMAAIGLPVFAHLLSRRGGRTIVFPAVRFVMQAAAEHARRHRLRDILLLLLRAGAIALIALAFDRPVWMTDAARATDARNGRDVVIVLDASASMTRTQRGRTLYDVAKDRAAEILAGLDWSRDRAGVIFAGTSPSPALPRLSGNREALAARVRESDATLEHADLTGALALASTIPGALDVDPDKARPRRIVVIGDRQRTQWEDAEAPIGAEVAFVGVGPDGPTDNLAVLGVTPGEGAALTGREVVVSASVANFSDRARAARVVLREVSPDATSARELGASTPTIGPNGRATLTFAPTFAGPGLRRLEVALIDDAFAADDVGRAVVDVVDARRIVMVTRARPGDMRSAAYFWEAALAPDAQGVATGWRVERVAPDDFAARTLEGAVACVVVNARAIPDRTIDLLRRFASGGGGVVWVADSNGSASALAGFASGSGIFAASQSGGAAGAGEILDVPAGVAIGSVAFDRANMTALAGPVEAALHAVRFTGLVGGEAGPAGVVLARFATGEAWITEGPIGAGRLIALGAPMDPDRASLVKSPVFPVLAGEIAGAVTAGAARAEGAFVGEPVTVDVSAFTSALHDARGGAARVTDDSAGRLRVALDPSEAPGFVGVLDEQGAEVGAAPINVDPRESDTGAMTDAEIDAILSGTNAIAGPGPARTTPAALLGRRPIELWGWLMAGALVLLGVESLVASARARSRTRSAGSDA